MVKKSDGSLCAQCTALCCHYITVDIDEPLTNQARDDVRWYLLHEGVTLLIEKDRWLLQIATTCRHLQKDHRCGIYEKRPKTCKNYSTENCDYHTIHEGWETDYLEIKSAEEFDAYLKEERRKARQTGTAKKKSIQKKTSVKKSAGTGRPK